MLFDVWTSYRVRRSYWCEDIGRELCTREKFVDERVWKYTERWKCAKFRWGAYANINVGILRTQLRTLLIILVLSNGNLMNCTMNKLMYYTRKYMYIRTHHLSPIYIYIYLLNDEFESEEEENWQNIIYTRGLTENLPQNVKICDISVFMKIRNWYFVFYRYFFVLHSIPHFHLIFYTTQN